MATVHHEKLKDRFLGVIVNLFAFNYSYILYTVFHVKWLLIKNSNASI